MYTLGPPGVYFRGEVPNRTPLRRVLQGPLVKKPPQVAQHLSAEPLCAKQVGEPSRESERSRLFGKFLPVLERLIFVLLFLPVDYVCKREQHGLGVQILSKTLVQELAAECGIAALEVEVDHELSQCVLSPGGPGPAAQEIAGNRQVRLLEPGLELGKRHCFAAENR